MSHNLKQTALYALLTLSALLILGVPLLASATSGYEIMTTLPGTDITKGTSVSNNNITLQKYVQQIYIFALGIVGLVAVAAIVFWSFMYIAAAGNPSKMTDAMSGIKDAILGLVLLLLASLILGIINPKLITLKSFDYLDAIPGVGNTPAGPQPEWKIIGTSAWAYDPRSCAGIPPAGSYTGSSGCTGPNPSNPPTTEYQCCIQTQAPASG